MSIASRKVSYKLIVFHSFKFNEREGLLLNNIILAICDPVVIF